MRFLLAFIGLLIVGSIGWKEPYRDLAVNLFPWAGVTPSRLAILRGKAEERARATPSPSVAHVHATPKPYVNPLNQATPGSGRRGLH